MKNREHYKGLLKKDYSKGGVKPSDGKSVPEIPNLIIEMFDRQNKLNDNFRSWDLEKGIRWLMGYANFINQNSSGGKFNKNIKKDYVKGTIIMVDFFGNFGNELTYDHPAIVVAESGFDLIIAPISSTPTLYGDSHYYHIDLPKNNPVLGGLRLDSVIKLEQLRYISKKRILDKKNRVKDNAKLEEIDVALMQLLAEKTFNKLQFEMAEIASDLETEKEESSKLVEENTSLKAEVLKLKQLLEMVNEGKEVET